MNNLQTKNMQKYLWLFMLICASSALNAQYQEFFPIANKGYQINLVDDITGVNWTMTPWALDAFNDDGRDATDYFNTTAAGKLEGIDFDQEVCWESPLINTQAAATVSIKANITWTGFDADIAGNGCVGDYIRVYYSVNGGAYTMIPNQVGGNPCATVAYTSDQIGPFASNLVLNFGGVTGGSTLKIRLCASMNANAELVTFDNVEVPEAGVFVGCAAPALTTAVTPVGCNGPNTGAINLSVAGGNPPYSYDWSNDGPETPDNDPQDLSGLAAGVYTVTVTDAASCSATISATVAADPAITLSTFILDATCTGSPDGEVDLTVSGGFGPFTFDWSNDGPEFPDNDLQDLLMASPGTYTVTVTDAVTCTKTISATIGTLPTGAYMEQFNTPNKGYLLNNVDDFTGVNWSISSWTTGREVDDFFNSSGGVLTGADFDEVVCWNSPVIDLNGGTQFSVDLSWATFDDGDYINVSYSLDGIGFVSVPNVVGGGASTIQYAFPSTGQSGSTTVTKTGLSGNTLEIQVCGYMNVQAEVITIDNVNVPGSGGTFCPGPSVSLSGTNVTCFGGANGTVTSTVVDGQSPYTYAWSNGANSANLTNVMAGTYTVVVTDANSATASASITISQAPQINLSVSPTNVLCNGAATGAINLTVSGGTPGYTYAWTGGATVQDPANLLAGTYTVTVTDAANCTKTISATISQPPVIALSTTQVNVLCNGASTGAIDLTVGGGTPGYTYAWTGGAAVQDPANLAAGTYTVTVTDANNCTKTTSVTLTQPMAIVATATQVNLLCNGNTNGSIDLSVSGGTPGYTYAWSHGPNTQDVSNLAAGTYTVVITDGNNCTKTLSTTITQPPVLSVSSSPMNVSCNGLGDGSINLTVSGGTPGYTFNWSNGANTEDISNLTPGTYTVVVSDLNNCSTSSQTTITEPAVLQATATTVNPSGCGVADGSIDLSVSGGTINYTYDWSNDGPEMPDNDLQDLTNLVVGTYTVTVTDANGCSTTLSRTLSFNDQTPPSITCPANLTINANGTCQGTLGSYSPATLSDNCTLNPTVVQSPAAGTVLSGHNDVETVTLTATDANNNSASCTFTVTLKDVTAPSITCPANATVNANASCQGQVGAYTPTSLADNCNPSPTVIQSPASSTLLTGHNSAQTVTLTASDGNGNSANCTFTVTLKDVTAPSITCPANTTVAANASCQGQLGFYTPTSLSDNCNPSPVATQSPSSGTFLTGHNTAQTVTLTANDGNGNTATCTFTVTLKDVTAPSITCPANSTINAGPTCSSNLGSYAALSTSDNCNPSPAVTQSPASSTVLSGHNDVETVTLTANDGNGNTANCTFTVTLKDVTAPSITCPANTTVAANASCQGQVGSYTPTVLTDNCNPAPAVTQSPSASTALTGHNDAETVTLTANDGNGNTANCTFTVTLKDVTPPTINCPANLTLAADGSCSGVVGNYTANSTTDNCNPSPAVLQSPAGSTVLSGHNDVETVTLTAIDGNGNNANCTFTVTLKDVTPPTITCPANTTINAGPTCSSNLGSYAALSSGDNCNPSPAVTQSPSSSTLLSGHNDVETVTLTANDGNGNTANCTFTVTLKDVTAPSITCPANVTVAANATCSGTVGSHSPASLSDNCNPASTVTQSPASSTALSGHNDVETVTLTANDGNGNTANCTFTVTLKDVTPPSITCPSNTTLAADANCSGTIGNYGAAGASDNCAGILVITQTPAPNTTLNGHNDVETVTLTANDGNGNNANCTFTVTLKDLTPPTVVCKPFTAFLNSSGVASITPANVYQSGTDNCGAVTPVSVSPNTFNCNNLGANNVVLTVNDVNGNTSTCTAVVTVVDAIAPTMICRPVTVFLNSQGVATITPAQVNNGSFDNCGIVSFTLSPSSFTCAQIGNNIVELGGIDQSNNKASCQATVTVVDAIAPTALCKNLTVNLPSSGSLNLLPSQINNGSSDNCSFTLSVLPNVLTCANVGTNLVTLRVTDTGGNTATCTATVIVRDLSAPNALCRNATIFLDQTGQATLSPAAIDNGSSDACGIVSRTLSQTQFNCSELAGSPWAVTMTIRDANNNTSSCQAYVTVRDNIAPTAICEDATVYLNQNNQVIVYTAPLADQSTDNCSVWSYTPTLKIYNASNLGTNNLSITVKDWSGNAATCVSVVTVLPYNGNNGNDSQSSGDDKGNSPTETMVLSVFPNPSTGDVNLSFELPEDEEFTLRAFDMNGRLVYWQKGHAFRGENKLGVTLTGLMPGMYLLDLETGNNRAQKRIVIQQ